MEKINQVWRIKKLQVDISCLKKLSFWKQSNHAHDQIILEGGFQRVPSNASLWQLFEHFFLNFVHTVVIFVILWREGNYWKGESYALLWTTANEHSWHLDEKNCGRRRDCRRTLEKSWRILKKYNDKKFTNIWKWRSELFWRVVVNGNYKKK